MVNTVLKLLLRLRRLACGLHCFGRWLPVLLLLLLLTLGLLTFSDQSRADIFMLPCGTIILVQNVLVLNLILFA